MSEQKAKATKSFRNLFGLLREKNVQSPPEPIKVRIIPKPVELTARRAYFNMLDIQMHNFGIENKREPTNDEFKVLQEKALVGAGVVKTDVKDGSDCFVYKSKTHIRVLARRQ